MSLRDDFEEWWGADFPLTRNANGTFASDALERKFKCYQAATERAVRIVEKEQDADYDDHRNRVKTILRRLKDES